MGCNCRNCGNAAQCHADTGTSADSPTTASSTSQRQSLSDLCIEEEKDSMELDEIEDIMDFVFEAGEMGKDIQLMSPVIGKRRLCLVTLRNFKASPASHA